jgi:hypothetical protein
VGTVATVSEVPWIEAATIGREDAHATWALAARMRLEEAARSYHGVVTVRDLADWVQERSRIRTRQQPRHWLGDVLYRTMVADAERGEPFLASVCVDADGRVTSGYAGCVEHLRGARVGDADEHAGRERLACYRRYADDLPAGGGEPGPAPRASTVPGRRRPSSAGGSSGTGAAPSRGAASGGRRVARSDVVPKVCPQCHMALPASGQCDTCD